MSAMALKGIKATLEDVVNSPVPKLQKHGKDLISQYFPEVEQRW
ncbi:hypothetical protein [Scytonema sp. NUACC21]